MTNEMELTIDWRAEFDRVVLGLDFSWHTAELGEDYCDRLRMWLSGYLDTQAAHDIGGHILDVLSADPDLAARKSFSELRDYPLAD